MKMSKRNDVIFWMGENAKENWKLLENANVNDIWVHLMDYPSCYVVIHHDEKITDNDIMYAGQLCKIYSRFKHVLRVRMCYLDVKYVKKGKVMGEARCEREPFVKWIDYTN